MSLNKGGATRGTLGAQYLAALIDRGDAQELLNVGEIDHLFRPHELETWQFVKHHLAQHGVLPARDTANTHTLLDLPSTKEPPSYYLDHLQERHIDTGLKAAVREAGELLKRQGNKDPRGALEMIGQAVVQLQVDTVRGELRDFSESHDRVLMEHSRAVQGTGLGIPTGWGYLDRRIGGMRPGDLYSIVGRPGEGKTWSLIHLVEHAWHVHKVPTLLVSNEMSTMSIEQRLAAKLARLPHHDLRLGRLTDNYKATLSRVMQEARDRGVPLWIVDASQVQTVQDIIMLVRQLKPGSVAIDGGYLMKHPDRSLNKMRRVGAVCDEMKFDLAMGCGVPVSVTWQLNRDSVKKRRKDEPIGVEDISYADEIGQNSTTVTGLIADASPETIRTKEMALLKDRDGAVGAWRINWNFSTMDMSEAEDEDGTIERLG